LDRTFENHEVWFEYKDYKKIFEDYKKLVYELIEKEKKNSR